MDYVVFITGLFLLNAGLGSLFLYRDDKSDGRWLMPAVGFSALGFRAWAEILIFALDAEASFRMISPLLLAIFACSLLAFCLWPLSRAGRAPTFLKWAAILVLFLLIFVPGVGNPSAAMSIVPAVGMAFLAGWKIATSGKMLFGSKRSSNPLLISLLVATITAACVLPDAIQICYDTMGFGYQQPRIEWLALLSLGAACSIMLCYILWATTYRSGRGRLSPSLIRRRRIGTSIILTIAFFTTINGAWIAHWLGIQAQMDKRATIISALKLGAYDIEAAQIDAIKGVAEEINNEAFVALRAKLIQIRDALPGTRYAYLLGMRDGKLVFLADAEDPSSEETFSPPGEPVHDYPQNWQAELAGQASFKGPDRDEWGVWFTACVPALNKDHQVIALLGVDYPAGKWLQPVAKKRVAAMGTTLSLAVLLIALFSFHLMSVETARQMENLSERLSDAMIAAEFDTWECFPKPFKLNTGDRIGAVLGWTDTKKGPTFRQVWRSLHPEDRNKIFNLVRPESSCEAEVRLKDAQGNWLWFMLRGHMIHPHYGEESTRLVGTILNIDERQRATLEIDKERRFAQHVMESVPNGLVVVSPQGVISYANPAFTRLSHHTAESMAGTQIETLIPSVNSSGNDTSERFEATLTCRDGTLTPIRVFRASLSQSGGNDGTILAIVDLTSVREAERDLLSSRTEANRLALVAKRTDNAVVITDAEGAIEWVNEGFSKISGYSREEVIGKTPGSILQRANCNNSSRKEMREGIRSGAGFVTEILNYSKDGRAYLVHIECQPLIDKDGTLTGFMAIERDITQTRRSANLLEAVASSSTTLLSKRMETGVWSEILQALGTAADVDRSYLFRIHPHPDSGTPAMSYIAEWNSGAATPEIQNPNLQNLRFRESGYQRWYDAFAAGHEISGMVDEFPENEQPGLLAQKIRSIIVVPIFTNDELWGFLGLDACVEKRIWQNWEISILRSAAANIGLRQVAQIESDALMLARDEARKAAIDAERANRAKSTFLATMSHEIRTPLNAVIGMASLLETTTLNAQQQDFAETILSSSNFLLELINDILDYSRIESGKVDLDNSPFALADICREAFDLVRPGAAGKDIELIARISSQLPPQLAGDRARIRQILVNLLSNSVKFTLGGFVSLSVDGNPTPEGGWNLCFDVADSGIGINQDGLKRLFKPFVQEDSSTTRRFGGSGLGLAISKRLAELMGGDITAESIQGKGSTFKFQLSFNPCPAHLSTSPAGALQPTSILSNGRQNSILIVDDNELNRRILEETLAGWGLSCHTSASASDAIAQWNASGPFDLVITDHHMPEMDGADLVSYLRTLPNAKNTRFSLLGSESSIEPEIRALFHEVGSKPIWPSSIHGILTRLLPGTISEPADASKPKGNFESERFTCLKVLVAEDNPNNRKVIRLLLRRLGIEADIVADGSQAVEAARAVAYDVIFLDIQMPVMDGLEASRRIRAMASPKRPFVLALTANVFQEDRDAASDAGMDSYLAKPITLSRLREVLATIPVSSPDSPNHFTPPPMPNTPTTDADSQREFLDFDILENLAYIGKTEYMEIIGDAVTATSEHIDSIRAAIESGNQTPLKENLHRLRGMLLQIGCKTMPSRLQDLEANHESITPDQAGTIHTELLTLWKNSLLAIRSWADTLPEPDC